MLSVPPEIRALIISQLEIKDLSSLTQTSHAMLDCCVPYLWEDIKAEWLFDLLPGAHFERIGPSGAHRSILLYHL